HAESEWEGDRQDTEAADDARLQRPQYQEYNDRPYEPGADRPDWVTAPFVLQADRRNAGHKVWRHDNENRDEDLPNGKQARHTGANRPDPIQLLDCLGGEV